MSQILQICPGELEELIIYLGTYYMSCATLEKEWAQLAQAGTKIEYCKITQFRTESFYDASWSFVERIVTEPFSYEVKDASGIPLDQLLDKFLAKGQIDMTFFAYVGIPGSFMSVGTLCMKPSERTEILNVELERHGIHYTGKKLNPVIFRSLRM